MEYQDEFSKTFSEGLANKKLAPGEEEKWPAQGLEGIAEHNVAAKM